MPEEKQSYEVMVPPIVIQSEVRDGQGNVTSPAQVAEKVGEIVQLSERAAKSLLSLKPPAVRLVGQPRIEPALAGLVVGSIPANLPESGYQEITEVESPPPTTTDPIEGQIVVVENELREIYRSGGWRPIATRAESYAIQRPPEGWEAVIPDLAKKIVEEQQLQAQLIEKSQEDS